MARLKWHRRQRRLHTTYVEAPPGVDPEPLELDLPAFGPDRSFRLPEPGFPNDVLPLALSAADVRGRRHRLPEPPKMPEAQVVAERPTEAVRAELEASPSERQVAMVEVERRERERVILGESMGDVTVTEVDAIVAEPTSPDDASRVR